MPPLTWLLCDETERFEAQGPLFQKVPVDDQDIVRAEPGLFEKPLKIGKVAVDIGYHKDPSACFRRYSFYNSLPVIMLHTRTLFFLIFFSISKTVQVDPFERAITPKPHF